MRRFRSAPLSERRHGPMIRARRRPSLPVSAILFALIGSACLSQAISVSPSRTEPGHVVESPVKAHLVDGTTILFRDGVVFASGRMEGRGERFDLTLQPAGTVETVSLDSVAAVENFQTVVQSGESVALTILGTAGTIVGVAAAAWAIFGSCPTVYVATEEGPRLEAEAFSYSVAPIFEARDVDRIRVEPDTAGRVRLEIRNEAWETHYINHFQLLEAVHEPGERIVSGPEGGVIALSRPLPIAEAVDRDGRDVSAALEAHDGWAFETSEARLAFAASGGDAPSDLRDHIDVRVPVDGSASEIGLQLRMRNSILSTVLLYDVMLGGQGPAVLDWVGRDLQEIGVAVEVGTWAASALGLRVLVSDGDAWHEVGYLPDTGPIAWEDLGLVIPLPDPVDRMSGDVTVRLEFLADHWRIDHVTAYGRARNLEPRPIPLEAVVDATGAVDTDADAAIAEPDQRYLVTTPGQTFVATFDVGPSTPTTRRAFLLASQGYYVEWIRGEWLREQPEPRTFRPGPDALVESLVRYRADREDLERRFWATRVPVR